MPERVRTGSLIGAVLNDELGLVGARGGRAVTLWTSRCLPEPDDMAQTAK
jgi:hypothetical protein